MKRYVLVALLAIPVAAGLAAQGGTLTGRVLVRERSNDDHSLLVEVEQKNEFNRLQFTLPDRVTLSPGWAPSTWNFVQDGRKVTASGEPTYRLNLRLDARPGENLIRKTIGKDIELETTTAAGQVSRLKCRVGQLPRVPGRDDWARLVAMTFPPEVTPGAPIYVRPLPGFTDGVWIPHFKTAESTPPVPRDQMAKLIMDASGDHLLKWSLDKAPIRTSFFDRWAENLYETTPPWKEVPGGTCTPGITGGTPLALAGKDACMAGCFGGNLTELDRATTFLMDGQRSVTPQAASPTTIVIRIPADAAPGLHTFTFAGVSGKLEVRVMQVEGSIDQNRLWRGDSTTMRLKILGTDQPIPLSIVNRTPATIQMEGGERQVISTSGGADNALTRQVRGIMKGDFTIDFSVDQPACGAGR